MHLKGTEGVSKIKTALLVHLQSGYYIVGKVFLYGLFKFLKPLLEMEKGIAGNRGRFLMVLSMAWNDGSFGGRL
jgi:hypothetical protein